ncbi:MAG: hypothetical protein KDJ54_07345 [Candidatus Competibacteraceae bacterium]|nr:hypothetical protein [Candidatus Competibacteraceae bacterium]
MKVDSARVPPPTGRRISREGEKAEGADSRCRLDPCGCATRSAKQPADWNPPPRCRGHEALGFPHKLGNFKKINHTKNNTPLILQAF